MIELSGWGRYPRHAGEMIAPGDIARIGGEAVKHAGLVARGCGRSYGDAAIGERCTLSTRSLDRMRRFDPETGLLTVEAGVTLDDIIATFLPRGYFPPVVPGTRFVSVGGMIASDVHGKNQHNDGSFGNHVETLKLALADGSTITCSRDTEPDLFHASIGGMGLTGVIVEATLRMRRVETGWVRQETHVAADLASAIDTLRKTQDATYSVAWIDVLARGASLGRSLVLAGEHATRKDLAGRRPLFPTAAKGRLSVPINMPGFVLNRMSVKTFNELYFRTGARRAGARSVVPWDSYFFPLDGIGNWNRIYGADGFVQHQCVIPEARSQAVLGEILERISKHGSGSFLAVLKRLTKGSGLMSFPMDGFTLALDLKVDQGVLALLEEVDRLVVKAGGRLYLAKDARQTRSTFEAGYPELERFNRIRTEVGAKGHFASKLSERLGM